MIEHSQKQVEEIERRALEFCVDNPRFANELSAVKAAMLIGALVVLELDEAAIQLNAWHETFGTNQLTHALARLQRAEQFMKVEIENRQTHPNMPMPCCERPETRTSQCFTPR